MTMDIPLFPLHTVLSPGIALPLHIFEARYRLLVRRCLDDGTPFGVVLIRDGREVAGPDDGSQHLALAAVGTFAEIREATELPDGRWNLLVVGTTCFRLLDVLVDREPYLVGVVESIDDEVGDTQRAARLVDRVSRRFVQYLRLLQPRDGEAVEPIDVQVEIEVEDEDDEAEEEIAEVQERSELSAALHIPDDPSTLSFLLTGIVQVDIRQKQALLEAPNAEVRLDALDAVLDRELVLLENRLAPFTLDQKVLLARPN
jgi:uncharacterized protein